MVPAAAHTLDMITTRAALSAEPLLTAQEEETLARQVEAGLLAAEARSGGRPALGALESELVALEELGVQARQRFVRANLRLAASHARQAAARSRLPESDLFQEGCLGLICAVERFDFRRGFRFSTYASFWVHAYVNAATASAFGGLNLPASRASQLRLARGIEAELAQTHGRVASVGEVAERLGRSEKWTAELLASRAPQSLESLEVGALDVAAQPRSWEEVDSTAEWPGAELLWHLDGLEREVLSLRFGFTDGITHSYAEVSRRLAITASRARRLELRALEALRAVCPSGAMALL